MSTTEKRTPGQQRAIDLFSTKVEAVMERSGCDRQAAVARVRRSHPELHRNFIRATNKVASGFRVDEML